MYLFRKSSLLSSFSFTHHHSPQRLQLFQYVHKAVLCFDVSFCSRQGLRDFRSIILLHHLLPLYPLILSLSLSLSVESI